MEPHWHLNCILDPRKQVIKQGIYCGPYSKSDIVVLPCFSKLPTNYLISGYIFQLFLSYLLCKMPHMASAVSRLCCLFLTMTDSVSSVHIPRECFWGVWLIKGAFCLFMLSMVLGVQRLGPGTGSKPWSAEYWTRDLVWVIASSVSQLLHPLNGIYLLEWSKSWDMLST